MNKKQTVLLVHNYYKIPGGEDTVVSNEKRLLEEHGHRVFLYTRSNQELDSYSVWKKLLLPFTALFSFRTYREVKRLIKKEKIDVVHVHNTLSLISPSVYYAAFSCGIPVIQTMHNFRMLCPSATFVREGEICEDCVSNGLGCSVRHACYRGSKLQTLVSASVLKLHRMLGTYRRLFYICLTDFNRGKLLQLNRKNKMVVCESNIFVKPNFVWCLQEQPVQKKDFYIYVGRLDSLKGILFLLEGWKDLPEKKLLVCGSGPEEKRIRQYLEKNQMSQVELLGQLSHEKVICLLAEARALVMPSLWYEGQPMVILESYAVGTPVLASDLGNVGNMVLPGVTGLCFAPGNARELKQAVERFETIKTWNTKAVYEKLYEPEKNYEMLKEIYGEARERR